MDNTFVTLGTVGILTLLLVQVGKYVLPKAFRSDTNVTWSVVCGVLLQATFVRMTGGSWVDMWNSVPTGATTGYAASGLYRQISSMSKTNSVDLSEQAVDLVVDHPAAIREAMNGEDMNGKGDMVVGGFGK